MIFVGNTELTLDTKGRLILPTKYRDALSDGVVVTLRDQCLAIMPVDVFATQADHLHSQVAAGELSMDAFRSFTGDAESLVPDSQGRIRLSPELRGKANLDRTVTLSGALQHLEVWRRESYEEVTERGRPEMARAIGDGRSEVPFASTKKGDGEANP